MPASVYEPVPYTVLGNTAPAAHTSGDQPNHPYGGQVERSAPAHHYYYNNTNDAQDDAAMPGVVVANTIAETNPYGQGGQYTYTVNPNTVAVNIDKNVPAGRITAS
ncbi:hypothetical protein STCU_10512 [Strigomonas culicis]|uniref:Uncharacterized protein n=1 Tax=Strigomonas culicis TaxID=28005 RepID=S9TLE3_9TRYP|nr:hypothetical protein STCU_10512 [Strigomonas culicis]|eukprot:EPY17609.1 hypothetical protein STCU_10512 [Strigomonas culicis]